MAMAEKSFKRFSSKIEQTSSRTTIFISLVIIFILCVCSTSQMLSQDGIIATGGRSTTTNTVPRDDVEENAVHYKLVEEQSSTRGGQIFKRFAAFKSTSSKELKNEEIDTTLEPLSVQEWLDFVQASPHLIQEFTSILLKASDTYPAMYFETKGVSHRSAPETQFEFVIVKANALLDFVQRQGVSDYSAFQEHLESPSGPCNSDAQSASRTCCTFKNLSGTSTLVVPKPASLSTKTKEHYTHLAQFIRNASAEEIINLWQMAAREFSHELVKADGKTLWLSTAGGGVAWLHVRIDPRPKYYSFQPFKKEF